MIERHESQVLAVGEPVQLTVRMTRAEAFRLLSERHLAASYRLACAILGDRTEAHDGVQDAFVRAWDGWSSLRDTTRFEPWFRRILINTCRNQLRGRGRARVSDIANELEVAEQRDPYAATHDRQQLERALATLDPDHRIVVALRFYADLTVDDIAAQLDIPAGTVKSRLHHAMRRLQLSLDETNDRGTER